MLPHDFAQKSLISRLFNYSVISLNKYAAFNTSVQSRGGNTNSKTMKKFSLILVAMLFLGSISAQTARVNILHNSPDDAATVVDVYVNGEIAVPDFEFRTATGFLDLPAGTPIEIDIAPGTSADVSESVYNVSLTLEADETYLVVADGITGLSSTTYTPAPAFGLQVFPMAREAASMMGNTDVLVHHGSTDAPTVDVVEVGVGAGTIVDNASYPGFVPYLELPTADYVLAVQDENQTVTVATYGAPLSTLGLDDAAITVVASGFLDPSQNGDGPAFGLFAVTAGGGAFLALPLIPANDDPCNAISLPTDGTTGVYSNVNATVPAGEEVIAPPAGTDGTSSCVSQDGWCGGDLAIQNSVWFSFEATSSGVNISTCSDNNTIDTQVALYSATDCTDYSTLTLLGANDDVTDGCAAGTSIYASDLTYCGLTVGQTYWILVDSYAGEQGDFEISVSETSCPARAQVIHNSAEDIAASVDVYIDGVLAIPGFEFRTATPFIDLPGGVEINIDIAPGGSSDVSESIYNLPATLEEGATYIIVADGITGLSTGTYTPAPAFGLQIYDMGREAASSASNTDVLVHHGSTDAPIVDVAEVGVGAGVIVDDVAYTEFQGYLELATADYQLAVQTSDNATTVATYDAPLSTLALDGAAITVVASGFLDPGVNNDGPAFGLWVAPATGGEMIPLPLVTSVDDFEPIAFNMFPNPAQDELFIGSSEQIESIAIYDTQGRLVVSEANNIQRIDISDLSEGIYTVAVSIGERISTERLVKL
ncbi:MAG: DUF4397 domain-containing protein [Flavobacteriales bacterium]|nr:DUF4397 domain-containing protein [Flavobacteriales bacterium]